MVRRIPILSVAAVVAGLSIAPAGYAAHWRDGRHYDHHRGGNVAGAAIVGGLVGLGVGAAIASGGGYYYPPSYYPPPATYYSPPPAAYYAPPPAVYYGY